MCLTFHISSVVLFLIPLFLGLRKISNIKIMLLSTLIYASGSILGVYLISMINFSNAEALIVHKFFNYQEYQLSVIGVLTTYVINIFLPYLCLIFLRRNSIHTKKSLVDYLVVYIFISSISSVFPMLIRTVYFVTPVYIILLVEIIYSIVRRPGLFLLTRFFLYFKMLTIIFLLNSYFWFVKIEDTNGEIWLLRWVPYYSVFSMKVSPERESLLNH